MNLLLGYAVATKHYLRDEPGYRYKDLRHLVAHLPELAQGSKSQDIKNMPLEISFHIAAYVARCRKLGGCSLVLQRRQVAHRKLMDCLDFCEQN